METTITILKQHAPMALMLLAAVIYLQNDLGGEIQEIRADMAADKAEIRADMAALRADMNEEFRAVRADMNEEFKAVRAEMAEEFRAVRAEMADTNERLARVETRLDSIEDRLYMDTSLTPADL